MAQGLIKTWLIDLTHGMGMNDAMRLEMGRPDVGDDIRLDLTVLSQKNRAAVQAQLDWYHRAIQAGQGFKSSSSTFSAYEKCLRIRSWLLTDPLARSRESAWKPTEIIKLLPKPGEPFVLKEELGLTDAVMVQGMNELRRAWSRVPEIKIRMSTVAYHKAAFHVALRKGALEDIKKAIKSITQRC